MPNYFCFKSVCTVSCMPYAKRRLFTLMNPKPLLTKAAHSSLSSCSHLEMWMQASFHFFQWKKSKVWSFIAACIYIYIWKKLIFSCIIYIRGKMFSLKLFSFYPQEAKKFFLAIYGYFIHIFQTTPRLLACIGNVFFNKN